MIAYIQKRKLEKRWLLQSKILFLGISLRAHMELVGTFFSSSSYHLSHRRGSTLRFLTNSAELEDLKCFN